MPPAAASAMASSPGNMRSTDPGKNMTMNRLYTIGSSGKTAEQFFEALKAAGVKRLLDIRAGGSSQLAGYARRGPGSLDYLVRVACGPGYHYLPDLAPTREMMAALKNDPAFWPIYERAFDALLRERGAIEKLNRAMFDEPCCLLCTEPTPEHCHRRVVAEAIKGRWPEIEVEHLGATVPDSMRTGKPVPRIRESSRHGPGRSPR